MCGEVKAKMVEVVAVAKKRNRVRGVMVMILCLFT